MLCFSASQRAVLGTVIVFFNFSLSDLILLTQQGCSTINSSRSLKKSLQNRTNWIARYNASLQRSQGLPLERLWEKNKQQNKQKQKFFSEGAKRREKETQILTSHKTFIKMHIVQQTKHQLPPYNTGKMVFELQGIGWNLSMMRINYKFTKRTKTEK